MTHALGADGLRIVPLGGLGEIGANCLALEQPDGILLVDCGISFPSEDLGLELHHPDFSWLVERRKQVQGVFITHGHEDHIGALPFLLEAIDVPVWGPEHALRVARRRMAEHGFSEADYDFRLAVPGQRYAVGGFGVEPIRVTHSIVEATALHIETVAGSVVHTGDFHFDAAPPDGEPADERRLSELGDAGVRLLLSDSTNIDTEQRAGSEVSVGEALEELVRASEQRVVVAMFASNVQRLILIGEIARRCGRKICLLGRSLGTQVEVATAIGRLHWPSDLLLSAEQARDCPPHEILVLAGGTQAEPNSALRRLALGTHRWLQLDAGDTVVLSSRIIPGNERSVAEMLCDLMRRGLRVVTRGSHPRVHTSGHAGRSEQRRMLELVRPNAFLPVHGTLQHLLHHADLARSLGVPEVLVVENGSTALLHEGRLVPDGQVAAGKVTIAWGGEPIADGALRSRHDMARLGVAWVSLTLNDTQGLAAPPEVSLLGLSPPNGESEACRGVAREAALIFERRGGGAAGNAREQVRRAVRRYLFELCGSRPLVEVHVTRL